MAFSLGAPEVDEKGWITFQYLPNAGWIYREVSSGLPGAKPELVRDPEWDGTIWHGSTMYGLYSVLYHGKALPSTGQYGEDAAFGAGVYGFPTPYRYKALWYAKFSFLFGTRFAYRVMYE